MCKVAWANRPGGAQRSPSQITADVLQLGHVHVVVDSNERKLYVKQYRDLAACIVKKLCLSHCARWQLALQPPFEMSCLFKILPII